LERHIKRDCVTPEHNALSENVSEQEEINTPEDSTLTIIQMLIGMGKEIAYLRDEINKSQPNINNTTNNNDNSVNTVNNTIDNTVNNRVNNTVNNTLNINMVCHGQEDLSKLTQTLWLLAARKGINVLYELIKAIHFSADFQEFQNIYAPYENSNKVYVYEDGWITKRADEVINALIEAKKSFILNNQETYYKLLNDPEQKLYQRWLSYINNEDEKELEKYKKESYIIVKDILHNKRDIPIATRKAIKDAQKENLKETKKTQKEAIKVQKKNALLANK
jgi:hypothetical protein